MSEKINEKNGPEHERISMQKTDNIERGCEGMIL